MAPVALRPPRFGPKPKVTGLAIVAVGLGWLVLVRSVGTFTADGLPASLVAALGMSLAFIPSLGTAISSAGNLPALTGSYSAALVGAGIIAAVCAVTAGITLRGAGRQPAGNAEPVSVG